MPVGPRTATRAHPHGLTRREQEVLELICGGRTNTEIADRLYISARTVDHHVSAILAKLHAPTRSAAARRAAALGLAAGAEIRGHPTGLTAALSLEWLLVPAEPRREGQPPPAARLAADRGSGS